MNVLCAERERSSSRRRGVARGGSVVETQLAHVGGALFVVLPADATEVAQQLELRTKKKELVGDFKNAGREWRPKGQPELVRVHDFKDQQLGKAIPYGVYDIAANQGWVNVGIDHDTAQFAVNSRSSTACRHIDGFRTRVSLQIGGFRVRESRKAVDTRPQSLH